MTTKSPIKSGWRGNINGAVESTNGTSVAVSEITIKLDYYTAYTLCNVLTERVIKESLAVEGPQIAALTELGAAIGRLIDHHSSNNGGRSIVK